MGLAGTAKSRDFSFNTLFQNGLERQAVYERAISTNRSPTCPRAPCCLPSNEPGYFRFRPTRPTWRGTTCSTPPTSRLFAPGGVPETGSVSPFSFASFAIPVACWTLPRGPSRDLGDHDDWDRI